MMRDLRRVRPRRLRDSPSPAVERARDRSGGIAAEGVRGFGAGGVVVVAVMAGTGRWGDRVKASRPQRKLSIGIGKSGVNKLSMAGNGVKIVSGRRNIASDRNRVEISRVSRCDRKAGGMGVRTFGRSLSRFCR